MCETWLKYLCNLVKMDQFNMLNHENVDICNGSNQHVVMNIGLWNDIWNIFCKALVWEGHRARGAAEHRAAVQLGAHALP